VRKCPSRVNSPLPGNCATKQEAGTYDLRVDYRDLWLKNIEPFWIDDVVVEEGEENVVYAQVDTGKLTITLYKNKAKEKAALGPNVYDCRGRTDQECTSMDSEFFLTPDSIGLLNPSPSFDLRPGVYDIYVTGSGCALCPVANILFKGVRIEPGKVAKLEVCPVEEGTSECPGEIGRVGIAPWSEQYKQITVVNYGLEATGQTSGSGVKGPSATPSADTFGFNQPITDYSPIKPPAPSQPADPLLIILILAIVAVVAIFLGVFVFSKKSEKPVAKPTADGQTSSTLTDTEEVKKLVAQKADIEEKLRIAKARYYKREMDEGTFRQIVTKNQEELIDIESQIRKLDKRVKKLEDTVY